MLIAENQNDFQNLLFIQSVNIVMNIKSIQNTQENVFKHSFIEF